MASDIALQKAAQAWCTSRTQSIIMNEVLAEAFADIIDSIWDRPWLGNATNEELIEELKWRIKIHWDLNYKTAG